LLEFAKAIHKAARRGKSGGGLGLREFLKLLGSPVTFLERLCMASDFKFGALLWFAKALHKITHRGKSGGGLGLPL